MTTAATDIVPTDPSVLPQFNGRPVPWVTRWSGEVVKDPVTVMMSTEAGRLSLAYKTGGENRDKSGVLWLREGLGRKGEPEFAQVSTYRQRACMTKRLCQVCGSKITDRVISWLMSEASLETHGEESLTISPPTCAACVPLARSLCPHLRATNGGMLLRVLEYEVWGVYGDGVSLDPETGRTREHKGLMIQYFDRGQPMPAVVAKQQVARLTKFVREDG